MKRNPSLAASFVSGLALPAWAGAASLRFFGHGGSPGDEFVFPDRVKIRGGRCLRSSRDASN